MNKTALAIHNQPAVHWVGDIEAVRQSQGTSHQVAISKKEVLLSRTKHFEWRQCKPCFVGRNNTGTELLQDGFEMQMSLGNTTHSWLKRRILGWVRRQRACTSDDVISSDGMDGEYTGDFSRSKLTSRGEQLVLDFIISRYTVFIEVRQAFVDRPGNQEIFNY